MLSGFRFGFLYCGLRHLVDVKLVSTRDFCANISTMEYAIMPNLKHLRQNCDCLSPRNTKIKISFQFKHVLNSV